MGGKTSTTSSQVQIPPEVLARYNSVNATAQQVAQTPFQQYSTDPSAFVQPLTPTQTAGIQNTNAATGMAQPYFQAGTGFALAGSMPVNAQPLDVSRYQNPYLSQVLGSTEALVNQQNQQAMAGQTGSAINQGYFGGDRSGIASAVLQGQQELAGGQLYSGILSDAYQQALAAAQQQQGVQLGAEQANRAAIQQTGEALAGLGTGAQGAALQGAQAQLGAGQIEQQTGQAGKTALYNQFLQQQSYPFQTAQFLANIAEGTGALSGSTTTTTQPGGLFASDERLKEDMEPIGKGFDGANIYRFRYRGDPTTRIGFSAQEMERRHPEAVHEIGGFKAIEQRAATDEAARRGFALAANDNDGEERRARQAGGMSGWGLYPEGVNPMSIGALLQAQEQMYGPYAQAGLYGGSASGMPHGGAGYVPAPMQQQPMLMVAHPAAAAASTLGSDIHQVAGLADDVEGLKSDYHLAHQAYDKLTGRGGSGAGAGGGSEEEGKTMQPDGSAYGGRIGRAPGGRLTAQDYANQAAQYRAEAQIHAAAAAAHAQIAQRQARDRYTAAHPDTSLGAPGSILGAVPGVQGVRAVAQGDVQAARMAAQNAPRIFHAGHQAADALYRGNVAANQNLAALGLSGLGALGNWAQNQPWLTPHGPGWKPAPSRWVTDPNAYLGPWRGGSTGAQVGAQAGAAAGAGPPPPPRAGPAAAAPAAPPAAAAPPVHPAVHHAMQAAQHAQQAQAHAQAAQDLATGASGREQPDLVLNTGREQPLEQALSVGDVSNLQGGFAPANLHPYNPNIFQRFGNWLGDEFSGIGRWLGEPTQSQAINQDVAAANRREAPLHQIAPAPIQSEAFTGSRAPEPAPVISSEAFQSRAPPVAPPDLAAPPPAAAAPEVHPAVVAHDVDTNPVLMTAAHGGFARANGGATANPWSAEVSGSSNLTSARASRQAGGDLSNPYQPTGPGLNIPTQGPTTPKLQTPTTPGQGPSGLSNLKSIADIGADAAKIADAFTRGGRTGYADGGDPNDPYKPQGPGLDIPDQSQQQHQQLAVAKPPGQGQSGLGNMADIASIGASAAKFLPMLLALRRGGRAGYAAGGDPDAPAPQESSSAEVANWSPAVAQLEEQQHPQWVTPQIIAKGASGREKPLAPVSAPDTAAPTTPAPAIHDPTATPIAAAADAGMAAPPPAPGLGGAALPPSGGGKRGGFGGLLDLIRAPVEMVGDMAGYQGGGHFDKDRLIPFLTGIADMVAAPTKYPLVALTQGLKGGAQAYMAQQQAEAKLAEEQANAGLTRYQTLPPRLQQGMVEANGWATDPRTGQPDFANSHYVPGVGWKHWESGAGVVRSTMGQTGGAGGPSGAPQAGVVGSPGSAGPGVPTGAFAADYSGSGSPRYTIGPSSTERQQVAARYGINPNGGLVENQMLSAMTSPSKEALESARKQADDYAGDPGQLSVDQSNFREMIKSAAALPDRGLGAIGPGQGERQLLWNTLNTYGKMLVPGFTGFTDVDANSSNTEMLNKLSSLQSEALAGHYGQHAFAAADQLRGVLPSGNLQKASIYKIVTQMMVANERALDFNQYRQAYQQLGIGDYELMTHFDNDTKDFYNHQRETLPRLMTRAPGANESLFEHLEKNPGDIARFEQGYDTTNPRTGQTIHVPGYGAGYGKLFG